MRPRISQDFLLEHRRERIAVGLSKSVVRLGYHGTTVTDIVRDARIARNTFYDTFNCKETAALTMLAGVCPVLEIGDGDADGSIVLAIEIAAGLKLGDPFAVTLMAEAEQLLDRPVKVEPLEAGGAEDPNLSALPPGRHGLPREFVAENQRTRLLAGAARSVYEAGCFGATIADITRHAAVSRRTFYEHFDGKDAAVRYLVRSAESIGQSNWGLELDSGLGSLWAEVVAAAFCGDEVGSEQRRKRGQSVVRMLGAQVELKTEAA